MDTNIIVGGGLAGLIAAAALEAKGRPVRLLERSGALGGRFLSWLSPVFSEDAVKFLAERAPGIRIVPLSGLVLERRKGNWSEELGFELTTIEESFCRKSGFLCVDPKGDALNHLSKSLEARTLMTVEELRPEEKSCTLTTGETISYESLIWCAPLQSLNRALGTEKLKLKGRKKSADAIGGICWELEHQEAIFPIATALIFPFRHKDHRLAAIGFSVARESSEPTAYLTVWRLFLEPELLEDREETAKVIRTLKRELNKDFEGLLEKTLKERVGQYFPLSGEEPVEAETLELEKAVYYLWPEVMTAETPSETRGFDLTLLNCKALERFLS